MRNETHSLGKRLIKHLSYENNQQQSASSFVIDILFLIDREKEINYIQFVADTCYESAAES